jgi:predicted nucleic acid-binding protein
LKLVLDTNIVLSALIKASRVRSTLLSPNHLFFVPEYLLDEVESHLSLVREKTGLSDEEIRLVLNTLMVKVRTIPYEDITKKWEEAERIMTGIDEKDVPFVAAALSIECDGIWSDDRDLRRQNAVKVWNTKEILEHR